MGKSQGWHAATAAHGAGSRPEVLSREGSFLEMSASSFCREKPLELVFQTLILQVTSTYSLVLLPPGWCRSPQSLSSGGGFRAMDLTSTAGGSVN